MKQYKFLAEREDSYMLQMVDKNKKTSQHHEYRSGNRIMCSRSV